MEWRRTRRTAMEILEAEKETLMKIEGGKELFEILTHLFQANKD